MVRFATRLRDGAASGYARTILSLRSGVVAVVTSAALAFATPAFGSPPQASHAETPSTTTSADGATSVPSELPPPATILPMLGDPLEVTHGHLALQPWSVYGGTLATVLPNGGTTQPILSHNAKIAIIVAAIVVGVVIILGITYSATRPCCGPF